jgi:hypothetical protein
MNTFSGNIIRQKPIFLYLLPLFFVLHGYMENYDLVPLKDAFILALQYLAAAIVLSWLAKFYFHDQYKANFYSFFILCFQFFFGTVHDLVRSRFADLFITKYSFILPFSLLVFFLFAVMLNRKKIVSGQLTLYLNTLLVILLLIDTTQLLMKAVKPRAASHSENLHAVKCDTCNAADLYLIVADGYPGQTELKDVLGYDNTKFLQALKKRNFHIVDSSISNYNFTPFSMASMLNMNFIEGITGSNSNKNDMSICYNTIKISNAYRFFISRGYEFFNFSLFDFPDQPSLAKPTFLYRKTKLITSQTFLYRVNKEIAFHLATTFKLNFIIKYLRNFDLKNNSKLYSLTKDIAEQPSGRPKFVYTHLVMPHYPYYFDSLGKPVSFLTLSDDHARDKKAFLSYLKYANQKYLELIDYILAHSPKPPIILLMSDHGLREFNEPVDQKYHFMNLNTLLLPDSNYHSFYTGMSNVNQFRALLNTEYGQRLPMLKDSVIFIRE